MKISKLSTVAIITLLVAACSQSKETDPAQGTDRAAETATEATSESSGEEAEIASTGIAAKGKILFLKCRSCHTLKKGDVHLTGPNLYGFYDAEAGTREGYAYSDALIASGLTWNDEAMDAWLEQPTKSIPGTKMVFAGLPKQEDREAVMAYLKEQTQ